MIYLFYKVEDFLQTIELSFAKNILSINYANVEKIYRLFMKYIFNDIFYLIINLKFKLNINYLII